MSWRRCRDFVAHDGRDPLARASPRWVETKRWKEVGLRQSRTGILAKMVGDRKHAPDWVYIRGMTPLYAPQQFESAKSRDLLPLKCECCGNTFHKPKHQIQGALKGKHAWSFCSRACRDKAHSLGSTTLKCPHCQQDFVRANADIKRAKRRGSDRIFCSQQCSLGFHNAPRKQEAFQRKAQRKAEMVKRRADAQFSCLCSGCGKTITGPQSRFTGSKHSQFFCNKACRMSHYNRHVLRPIGSQKSRAEHMLKEMIGVEFPSVAIHDNVRDVLPSGLEMDLYFPRLRLAIELNGPTHYQPIYGEEALQKTQRKDVLKQQEMRNLGIDLIVIDISHLRNEKPTRRFLIDQCNASIFSVIRSKLEPAVGNAPT